MFGCPNCGGELRFHIPTQKMFCQYCESEADPLKVKETNADEHADDYGVTIFTCSQCGGELAAVDTSAAEFCTYCGASTILESRLTRAKKPKYIIPFQKTKEQCKEAFHNKMKGAFFLPSDFHGGNVDSFRGIYMPYWNYKVSQKGTYKLRAAETYQKGDYEYSDNYQIRGELDNLYDGISHDASSSFSDRISETLEPFDYKDRKPFTSAYMSGFYADLPDVESKDYKERAIKFANRVTLEKILDQTPYKEDALKDETETQRTKAMNTKIVEESCAMLPVWFLSYRKNDRVAYATVNGQTGKVISDMPIDSKRFLIASLITALPVFVLLNLALTLTPTALLYISMFLLTVTSCVYLYELSRIMDRDKNINTESAAQASNRRFFRKRDGKRKRKKFDFWGLICEIAVIAFLFFLLVEYLPFAVIAVPIVAILLPIYGIFEYKGNKLVNNGIGFYGLCAMSVVTLLSLFTSMVHDILYYGIVIASMFAIIFALIQILDCYNLLATRPLPQFNRKGGDDRA